MLKPKLEHVVCDECNNVELVQDLESGELVCQNCGYVISTTMIDQSPEWRAFNIEERDSLPRVGAPLKLSIHDMGLSTTIGWQNTDYTGRNLNPQERAQIYRLRKWDRRSKISDSADRNLAIALGSITDICNKLNLPNNIIETSSMIYRTALKRGLIKGRTIHNMATASVYMACRQCGVLRSLDEIAATANIAKKELAKNYRVLLNALKPRIPLTMPSRHISMIVNKLDLRGGTEILALEILKRASEIKMTVGKSPSGMAAACIYLSTRLTGEKITQSEVAETAQVTEVTIRNRYKELSKNLQFTLLL